MKKSGKAGKIERGQAITFRLPSDTPDHLINELQNLKDTQRRNFSSKIAEFVLEGVNNLQIKDKETITIPLPRALTKEQRDWLKHAHSEALLGAILYQLLADPVRATSVLASLNSSSLDIDEALYLQEQDSFLERDLPFQVDHDSRAPHDPGIDLEHDDDLMNLDWEEIQADQQAAAVEEHEAETIEENPDDLLGGFLEAMNK